MRRAIIIGAGPAGLTAAHELLTKTDIKPIVLEKSDYMGGISRTIEYKGNRIDIGGHRFFSKSDRVMNWWLDRMPLQDTKGEMNISYRGKSRAVASGDTAPDPEKEDNVMLVRHRVSRIYFMRKFFDYPISLSSDTIEKLGIGRTIKIGFSYMKSAALPIKNEKNLEQFFINRFGNELYNTFFKSYTEKVWGVPCTEISADWGAQRIKGLSIGKTISHIIKKRFKSKSSDLSQKDTETSLIDQFMYPKLGPGQMWEEVSKEIREMGGEIIINHDVKSLHVNGNKIISLTVINKENGNEEVYEGDYFFSTMPIKELIRSMDDDTPQSVLDISDNLQYRDFMTVGLLLNKLKIKEDTPEGAKLVKDNWIYIQEPDVLIGRLQIFNNWSPYLVSDPTKVWIGLEYFCYESDEIWKMADEDMVKFAVEELDKIGIIEKAEVLDATVIRVEKTYPAYFGVYEQFDVIRNHIDKFENLFLIGRNGMHRYNNQDHSMLTAMTAVENISAGITDKSNIWDVNTEQDYHEEKQTEEKVIP